MMYNVYVHARVYAPKDSQNAYAHISADQAHGHTCTLLYGSAGLWTHVGTTLTLYAYHATLYIRCTAYLYDMYAHVCVHSFT